MNTGRENKAKDAKDRNVLSRLAGYKAVLMKRSCLPEEDFARAEPV